MNGQPKAVFDCNTLLQGLAAPGGPAGHCVQLALNRRVLLFISGRVLGELREVAARPKVIAKLKFTTAHVDAFVEAIELAATVLEGFVEPFIYPRDPDDAHYVNLALAAGARLIVSRDNDLLDLMDSSRSEAAQFQTRFPELRIVTPVAFLRQVADATSE